MAISETQKVDYLWKKLAYGLSKTDTNANKRATNESIASPLLLRGENVWAQSSLVPGVMPGSSTGVVTVYPTSSPDETTADSSATLNRTWKTGLTDWISPEYGSTYLVKVYIHTAGQPGSAASSGTQVFGAGSGNNDEWFFDYQSGILHFIGTNLPSEISGKSIYVSGARYTGIKGVAVPGAEASFTNLNITGISTFAGNVEISSLLTANNLVVTGSTLLSHSNSLKLQTTGIGVSVSNGIGLTATIAGPSNLIIDPGVVGDNTGIVRIKGDLFVDGEQTQINSTTIELADFIVGVATTATSDLLTDGAGIQIGPNNTFLYEFNSGTNPSLKSSENLNVASGKVYQIDQTERLSADTLSLGTGTTIHSPASNALTFGTNGTEKVRITSDGDVGIGSVIPAGKLDVVGHTELDSVNVSGLSTFASNVDINANLDVDGRTELDTTNISETLNVVGISTFESDIDINASIDVDGRTELDTTNISETLNVVGIATFANNIDANANLDVDGRTELDITNISETLNVVGIATFVNNIDANANLDVDGRTELDITNISETLNVVGIATFASNVDLNADLDVDGRTELDITNISETLNVTGIATFASNVDLNADLDVDGRTELDITNISETLNVTGISTFENDVNVGGALSVTGNAFFVGMVTFAAGADGNITIGNANTDNVIFNADIDSSFIPDDTQTYDLGSSSQEWRNVFSKDIKVSTLTQNRVIFAGTNGKLQTSGNLEFIDGSQLTVGASLTVTGSLDVDGHTELDDVNVSGASTFTGNIDANGDLDVDGRTELDITNISETLNVVGISTFASDIDINASIDVDGHTELDNLNVSGVSTFTGAIDANGDLDVDGRTELDITNISETLNVTGISTFASDIDINASIDVDGHTELDNLNVSGLSTFVSNVNLSSNLDVDGQTDLDVLNVSETATFSSNIDANGNLDVDGTTELDVLNVAETATFSSNIDANGNLDVDGTTELDVLNVAETATFSSNIDANGDLDVDGHTELDDLNVSGVSTFASAVDINADLDVDGRTELDITNISETLNVTGIATFANNIDANGNLDVDGTTDLDVLNVSENATFNGRIVGSATTNVIPFLYSNLSDLPSASTYHGAFAHVHATGKAYYAHAGNWIELVNKNTSGVLDVVGHTELDDVNISGVATATAFHTGAEGSAIRVTSSTISGPAEIVIDPAAVGDNTGALRIKGDLFVDGTQTVINSTTVELADFIVGIATTATSDALADGAGIQIGPNNTLLYDHTNTSLKSSENLNLASGKTYKINGTDVLSATTLGSNVVNSSLTSLGTIATGVWQGTAINDTYIDTIDNANKVSLSALNIDGGTDIGALLADGDLIIVDDGAGGTNRKADVVGITTYIFSKVSGDVLISSSGAATIQANSVTLATDTTGDFVRSISGTTNEVTVSVTSGENVQPQIGLPDDVIVSNSLKVGTGITAQGGIITATTFVGNGNFANINVTGVSTFAEEIDANGRIVGSATTNVIPFLYSNLSDLPSASTYHGAFAHVHATGKGYYAHASNWIELVNKETSGVTGTGVENYNVGVITATTFDGDINLDNNNITGSGSVNITGIITAATLNVGAGGTVISANADTGTFAIGSATTSITATMNGGAIPSIGLVIALGG